MRLIRELEGCPPIHEIFRQLYREEDAVFLDSSLQNQLGRYSVIGLHPYLKLVKGEDFTVNGVQQEESFEDFLRRYLKEHPDVNDTGLPIVSGAIGYFSYEYGRKKEGVRTRHETEVTIPDCILNFYDDFIIQDEREKRLYLVANGIRKPAEQALEELEKLARGNNLRKPEPEPENRAAENPRPAFSVTPNFEKEAYKQAVQDMIRYITEGDIYIANMTQHLKITSPKEPWEVFEYLRLHNPSPFGGYFHYGDFQVVCASPERFLRMQNGHVMTRPIKGTRKRGATPEEDLAMRRELEASEKDKSELLMIVDLERNDLNRVCVPGSVKVTELFTVEEYATVFHLVSNVEGDLAPGMTVMDLIEAAFPGGSITGAPKLRAMEIIDELEHGQRNLYTGSMGYLTLDGCCDFNIVIRTALYRDGAYYLGVGGGITCESELEFEYEETLQKAKAILEALQE